MNEIWKDIKGYEGYYQISNLGRVRSLDRIVVENKTGHKRPIRGKMLSNHLLKIGYYSVGLSRNGKCELKYVHRLVAEAFIPNPNGYDTVNHIDENPKNNSVENLEWCTHQYNITYRDTMKRAANSRRWYYDTVLTKRAKGNGYSNKAVLQFDIDGNFIREWDSESNAARSLGINEWSGISAVCKGKKKSAFGYIWRYANCDISEYPNKHTLSDFYKKRYVKKHE